MSKVTKINKKTVQKKKDARKVKVAIVHVNAHFNNTIAYITDEQGNVIAWSSAGANGFKGSRKSTPFAAQQTVKKAFEGCPEVREVHIRVKGPGSGREAAIKQVHQCGVIVLSITDVTSVQFGGCRPPNQRRV